MYDPFLIAWHIRDERKGGQWRGGTIWWYIWALINNYKFLREYYPFLKRRWNLRYPWFISMLAFMIRESSIFIPSEIKKSLKLLVESYIRRNFL